MGRVQVKLALVQQGVCRVQENSHLGWPDHTYYITNYLQILQLKATIISLFVSLRAPYKSANCWPVGRDCSLWRTDCAVSSFTILSAGGFSFSPFGSLERERERRERGCNKSSQMKWHKTAHIYCCTVLEVRSPKITVLTGLCPFWRLRCNPFPCLFPAFRSLLHFLHTTPSYRSRLCFVHHISFSESFTLLPSSFKDPCGQSHLHHPG